VALMSRFSTRIKTFTIAFADGTDNELAWARRVAEQFGTDHHELVISEAEAFAFYQRMIYHLDEPLADCVCIPFYYVSQLARDAGMKVVQVGEGADELFFGYPTYGSYARVNRWFWQPGKALPAFARRHLAGLVQPLVRNHVLRRELLQQWVDGQALFWGGALAFGEQQKRRLFDATAALHADPMIEQMYPGMPQVADSHALVAYHLAQLAAIDPQADFGKQMLYLELKQRLPELLLMRADKMAMAASIEAREPFLDHHLIEFMLNVPTALKFKGNTTKYLLKKAAEKFLPREIIYRKKVGFGAPTSRWLERGSFFPAQLARLAQQPTLFTRSSSLVQPSVNTNGGHRAVQNWVLQQLWAWEQQLS
jgi:asparagine synthase (glutamine-hydrolysing)